MNQNIHTVLERGERVENLQEQTNKLGANANQFYRGSSSTARKMKWNVSPSSTPP